MINIETFTKKIELLNNDDLEELVLNYSTVLEIIEDKSFEYVIEEYNIYFNDKETNKNVIRKNHIKVLKDMHNKIFNVIKGGR